MVIDIYIYKLCFKKKKKWKDDPEKNKQNFLNGKI